MDNKYKPDTPRTLDEAIEEIKAASREHAEAGADEICLGLNFALGVLEDLKWYDEREKAVALLARARRFK